jgi:linoleoyl-CoA desaturase
MSVPSVRFNRKDRPEFYKELNRRVNKFFKEKNLSKHANLNMKIKTAFMVSLYFIPLIALLSGAFTSFWPIFGAYIVMSLGMSGIGLSIMHDANHGAYSSNKSVNHALGYLINCIGGYHVTWKIQHNVLHHSYTNIHDHDEDLNQNVMRFSPNQEHKARFKYQAYYCTLFYGLLSIFRFAVKDLQQLLRYNRMGLLKDQGLSFPARLAELLLVKSLYVMSVLIIPIMILPIAGWQIFLSFFVMHYISGLIFAYIFQPAHILEEVDFYKVDDNGSVENSWAIHEMRTTANFANGSTIFAWFIGGLNHQVEHHLFPHICHVHYKKLSKIVKATAEEYDVPYYAHKTFFDAVKSHLTVMNQLGTGEYDQKLKEKKMELELAKA